MITLKPITMDNFREVIDLKQSEDDKKMVAHNMYSLAEAYADKVSEPKAIYDDQLLVGFVMYDYNKEEQKGYISRLMIATEYQGRGYGTKGLKLALDNLKAYEGIKQIQISYHPDNDKARRVYKSLGFEETNEYVDEEIIAYLQIRA